MGSRGNIVFLFEGGHRIYLYTHHRGHEIATVLRDAMNHREPDLRFAGRVIPGRPVRWDDPAYFARVVLRHLTMDAPDASLGVGVSPTRIWPDFDELHVDSERGVIRAVEVHIPGSEIVHGEWSFPEFAAGGGPARLEERDTLSPME